MEHLLFEQIFEFLVAFLVEMLYNLFMKFNSSRYQKTRSCIYRMNYHIIWCVKYRNQILSLPIENALRMILIDIAKRNGFSVEMAEVGDADHVHCFVSAPPSMSVTEIVKHLKGGSAILLFRMFPCLRNSQRHGQLWSPSYFVETIGSTSEENIRKYIARQDNNKERPNAKDHSGRQRTDRSGAEKTE